ncbi:MAG: ZIP family metal transporter [Candidatus Eremiobacterota bacterium]
MPLLLVKAGASLVLIFLAVFCGTLPVRMKQGVGTRRFFSLANCFSAGVFVGAGLVHMLADSAELLGPRWDFPVAFALCSAGFFLILAIDRLLGGHGEGAKNLSPLILGLILSVHSVVAGTAVGLETHFAGAGILIVALVAHKGSEAFALGVQMAESDLGERRVTRLMAIFSLMTPLGMAAGMFLSHAMVGDTALLLEGLFDAFAAGTFLYVGIMEILAEEFSHHGEGSLVPKFYLAVGGLVMMSVLAVWS